MNLNKLKHKTSTLVIIGMLVVLTILAPTIVIKPAYAAWWNSDWVYRKPITIDHTRVAADLTSFPLLIDLTDSDLQTKAQSDGDDIVFTDYNGTRLNHEIESYTAATGGLVAWVNVPSLSSSTDTVLYMYYGNSTVASQENVAGVWGSEYRMVQHLSESSGLHYDSSQYGNNGTYYGSQQGIAGKLDGADGFIGNFASAGSGDYIDCKNATSLNINQAITVSAWIKSSDQTLWNHITTKGCDSPNRVYQLSIDATEHIDFIINGDATNAKATTIKAVTIGEWSYVVGTYDRSNVKTFINGVENASKAYTTAINNNTVNLRIGSRVYGTGNTGLQYSTFHGSIDEVRVTAVARSSGWILTEFNNQNSPSTFYSVGSEESETPPPPPPPAPWWNTHWLYRKNITINHLMIKASLASFPVLINVVDPDLKAKAQADGDDIVFTDCNGTKLNHEIESYTAATGKLVAWVNVPSLSSSTDTVLYMYYGNSTVASQENVAGVWGSEYRMVQHLSESSGLHYDSSQYGNNGTYYGSQQGIAGKLDGADSFVGNLGTAGGDYVDCGNSSSLNINDAITVSAWIKPTDQTQWNHITTKGGDLPNRVYQLSIETNEQIDFIINGDVNFMKATTSVSVPIGAWSYVVGTYDRNNIKVYIDGVERISVANTTAINTNSVNLRIASRVTGTGNTGLPAFTFDGVIDEVRVSSLARSADWIETEYNSQNNPAEFFIFGAEEAAPFTAQFVAPTPDDAATILTTTATINISTNMNLSSSNLIWWSNPPVDFQISIDTTLQSQWGFQYPVTYIFNIPDGSSGVEVFKRQNAYDSWSKLPEKTQAEFFNGIECVRFDAAQDRAYVSVGFNTTDKIYLRFTNVAWVTYSSIARYYDNRKATYTLSNDNWGKVLSANPGATWQGMTDDDSDSYQASIHAARMFNLPISIAINTYMAGGSSMWQRMQEELNLQDYSWEPAIHTRTHPNSASEYSAQGYDWQILGCRNDILGNLTNIPYGNYVFEFVLPSGYQDNTLQSTSQGEFLFLRDWTGSSNPSSVDYSPWNTAYEYYGIGGWETKSYDSVLQSLSPSGTYNLAAVNELNTAFNTVYNSGGIFYAMFHSDRYQNSIIYNASPNSSTLMEHFRYLSNRKDVWYVANGWLYSYHMVAERASVSLMSPEAEQQPMIIHNEDTNTFAYYTMSGLTPGETYHYQVECNNTLGQSILTAERTFTVAAEINIDLQAIGINVKTNGCSIYANDTYVNGTNYCYPVEVTVRNNGTQGSGSFFVKLEAYWINGSLTEGYSEIEVTALEGKTDLVVNFTGFFRPTHAGAYRLTVTVDSHSSISETNETNNSYSKSDVSVTIVGDINNDGTVNIFDAVIISLAWNATPSDPQWNVKADINHDNSVDIYDATRISLHWGERT